MTTVQAGAREPERPQVIRDGPRNEDGRADHTHRQQHQQQAESAPQPGRTDAAGHGGNDQQRNQRQVAHGMQGQQHAGDGQHRDQDLGAGVEPMHRRVIRSILQRLEAASATHRRTHTFLI